MLDIKRSCIIFKFIYQQQEKTEVHINTVVSSQAFQFNCYFHTYCLVSAGSNENVL